MLGLSFSDRPLWTKDDLGYTAPTMTLRRDPFSLPDGMQLLVEGTAFLDDIAYEHFSERSFHVIVEVLRGPLGHKYDFTAPKLTFAEECDVYGPSVELNMPGGGIHVGLHANSFTLFSKESMGVQARAYLSCKDY